VKWFVTLAKALGYAALAAVVAMLLFPALSLIGFYTAAWIGEKTGWYRVEDYMCMNDDWKTCEEWIAEEKRQRENRPPANSNSANKP
jgi:hypothetical protein